jgi:hypothetical protein
MAQRNSAGCTGSASPAGPDGTPRIFFARRVDGTGVLIDARPDGRVSAADSAVFAATAAVAGQAGWAFDRLGELPAVRAANLRWLAGYRHPRYARAAVMAALGEAFAEPGPLRAGAAEVGDPVAVLPVLFACGGGGWLPISTAGCWTPPRRCGPPRSGRANGPASGAASRRHGAAAR